MICNPEYVDSVAQACDIVALVKSMETHQAKHLAGALTWIGTAHKWVHHVAAKLHSACTRARKHDRSRIVMTRALVMRLRSVRYLVTGDCIRPFRPTCYWYTDASDYCMGFYEESTQMSLSVPFRENQRGWHISRKELFAILHLARMLPRGSRVHLRCDNEAALRALNKGHSTSLMFDDILHHIATTSVQKNIRWHAEYVQSALNKADAPSRPMRV